MADEAASKWRHGNRKADFYSKRLAQSAELRRRRQTLTQVVKAEQMPWEDSPQGRIKHIVNADMETIARSMDCYMQEISPGGRSGRHRHVAEEQIYVLEGRGYDLHWDVDADIQDEYRWKISPAPGRYDWEEGDLVLIPVNTVHQHFNADASRPAVLLSASSRIYAQMGHDDLEQLEEAP